ncbi:uncharacterized protein LOC131939496 [Physella acuta]|uniref:uncharacterized protein LOC131939496 n=1 Tax=Physella acuta TaxID=109671 RepID=UPI0027DAC87D|nr:uncharacterized protein LOC131939496 [Physella acuta]
MNRNDPSRFDDAMALVPYPRSSTRLRDGSPLPNNRRRRRDCEFWPGESRYVPRRRQWRGRDPCQPDPCLPDPCLPDPCLQDPGQILCASPDWRRPRNIRWSNRDEYCCPDRWGPDGSNLDVYGLMSASDGFHRPSCEDRYPRRSREDRYGLRAGQSGTEGPGDVPSPGQAACMNDLLQVSRRDGNQNSDVFLRCPPPELNTDKFILKPCQIDILLSLAASNGTNTDMVHQCKYALMSCDIENCINNYLIAAKFQLCDVMDRILDLIRLNFMSIIRTREFLSLPCDVVVMFLTDSNVNVTSELEIFFAALSWVDFNKMDRMPDAGRVLNCVRYVYIDPEDIIKYVEPNLHLFTGEQGMDAIINMYRTKALILSGTIPMPPGSNGLCRPNLTYDAMKNPMAVGPIREVAPSRGVGPTREVPPSRGGGPTPGGSKPDKKGKKGGKENEKKKKGDEMKREKDENKKGGDKSMKKDDKKKKKGDKKEKPPEDLAMGDMGGEENMQTFREEPNDAPNDAPNEDVTENSNENYFYYPYQEMGYYDNCYNYDYCYNYYNVC